MQPATVSLRKGERLLAGLLRQGIEVAHDCGGALACVSCVVLVRQGAERLIPANDDERDVLDKAFVSDPRSRLACQAIAEDGQYIVELPSAEKLAPRHASALHPVTITERAARYLAGQLAKRATSHGVRLSVRPAGCSGFSYRIDVADNTCATDAVFECERIRIFVDADSLPFVHGATLDFVEEGLSRRLRVENPNASDTCGCGESFSV